MRRCSASAAAAARHAIGLAHAAYVETTPHDIHITRGLQTLGYGHLGQSKTPSELATFLARLLHGPGRTFTWGGEQWKRSLTPTLHLPMATCEDLGLKVLQQNPQARSEWARLAREGHDVWQVLDHGRYLGVIVDGVYHSYQEIGRARHVT